jgi:23S rRNA pseudouridine2604 synthase
MQVAMTENLVRLPKIMSERGICSRREAEQYIEMGLVKVDGKVINVQGTKIDPNARIELIKEAQKKQDNKVTILLHKPVGYVSNLPEKGYIPAIELINEKNQIRCPNDQAFKLSHKKKMAATGRLDIDSKGLIVFTQDGVLAKKLIGQDCNIEKEYLLRVEGTINNEVLSELRFGLSLDGKPLKKAKVDVLQPNILRIILTEGKKRQIRRMCELVKLQVLSLKRVRIGNVCLGDLPSGKWRYLTSNEEF